MCLHFEQMDRAYLFLNERIRSRERPAELKLPRCA